MADTSFDIIIIGSGPGGYVTAIRAAQLGFKTAIVEKSWLGGICLNWGCIPTKALLRSSEIYHYMQHAKDYGLSADNISYDPKAVVARSRGVSKRLNDGVGFLMKKNKVSIIWGDASIDAPGKVTVKKSAVEAPKGTMGEGAYQAKHIIVATGARPRVLPGLEPDKKLVWTYFEAMVPDKMPKSLLVVGSGAIGMEFASFFRTMGSEVTVVEVLPHILPVEDAEISKFARLSIGGEGLTLRRQIPELAHLGIDPFEDQIGWDRFAAILRSRTTALKAVLMDQDIIAGIGNIYADETLYNAGILYDRPAESLSTIEIRRLHRAITEILTDAIKHRGSTLDDEQFVDPDGRPGDYQKFHQVYNREGQPCGQCRAPILRVTVRGRSTYYCAKCQN